MIKKVSRLHKSLFASLIVGDAIVFGAWNPDSAPSLVLIIGFLLLIANVYALSLGLLKLASWYGLMPSKQLRRLARIATSLFGGLIALQSIGELSPRDVLVLLPFVLLTYLYVSYGRGEKAVRAPLS